MVENLTNSQIDFEPAKDVFMRLLPKMLKHHRGEHVAIKVGEDKPFFGKDPLEALRKAKEKYKEGSFLVQEVSDEYVEFGRDGKPVEVPSLFL